ncbi:gp144 [Sphingomonas phage PAU]|uniref:gp144 n=1 Tax=Sphingomonas phage PAU TaxID=1150991 RepID=UPI00025732DC|nr:gp144 [Sphingomonas phage PAU]AFF28142.1 gp144 [Sphingomonas phage PAU]
MKTLTSLLFESYNSDIRKLELKLQSFGYTVRHDTSRPKGFALEIRLPKDQLYVPEDLEILSKNLEAYPNLLMIDAKVGEDKNYVDFIFPVTERFVDKVYHVTSKKWIESITEKGLLCSRPTDASDNIKKHESKESFRDRKYKAVFVISNLEDAKKVSKMFDFEEPQLIELDTKNLKFFEDPMMPEEMDSLVHFDDIEPKRIINITDIK